jgi:hypothetical protein
MHIKLKSPLDFLAEALEINKKSTAFRMAKAIEKERIYDALKAGINIESGIKEFKGNHLTYMENFKNYYNKNYK